MIEVHTLTIEYVREDGKERALDNIRAHLEKLESTFGVRASITPFSGAGSKIMLSNGMIFSPREIEVLRALCTHWSNKAIGAALGISEGTVKVYIKNVMRRVNLNNRTSLALWFTKNENLFEGL